MYVSGCMHQHQEISHIPDYVYLLIDGEEGDSKTGQDMREGRRKECGCVRVIKNAKLVNIEALKGQPCSLYSALCPSALLTT